MSDIEILIDRYAIEQTIYRLGRCLDDREFDGLRDLFSADATVHTPGGAATGHDALVEQAQSRHSADEGIQHAITNILIDHDGDRAAVRANLQVTFAKTGVRDPAPFVLGEVYRFDLVRTAAGWRIQTLNSSPVWVLNLPAHLQGQV